MLARIDTTVQVLSTCIWVDAAIWWIYGQYKDTSILWDRERQDGKLTLFASVYFTNYSRNRSKFNRSGGGVITKRHHKYQCLYTLQWLHHQLQSISLSGHFRVFLDSPLPMFGFWRKKHDSQESVLYWKFTDIKEFFQLKDKIPVSRSGVSYGDSKIKCLRELAWCV